MSGGNHFGSFFWEPKCSSEPKGTLVQTTLYDMAGGRITCTYGRGLGTRRTPWLRAWMPKISEWMNE